MQKFDTISFAFVYHWRDIYILSVPFHFFYMTFHVPYNTVLC